MTLPFDNSYARMPDRFYARQAPTPVRAPTLIAVNRDLAERLGLDPDWLSGPEGVEMLAGNRMPEGTTPIAQAYAGHQFGGWVPRLGDGRAVLLGEVVAPDGQRFDIQLKGAGRTPFSRGGDGRAWLGPVLREYVVSEAMAALGLPTTRALAAVTTGETIARDGFARPGAVFTRVAASHIRVGTFQFFAARGDIEALRLLTDHVIARHYPEADGPLGLLRAVVAAQAQLIAGWMAVGFIHGVMNTDNMAVSGETIDYGPCAFMDAYHPQTVFSSIDQQGRYAYANQPQIAAWNLAQLASCLLPLLGEGDAAIDTATEAVNEFVPTFQQAWLQRFGRKIGLAAATEADLPLIQSLLSRMADNGADFTRTFRGLVTGAARDEFIDPTAFDAWEPDWRARLAGETDPQTMMAQANPVRIPRNHRIEAAIAAGVEGDYAPFHRLNAALAHPYDPDPEFADLEAAPLNEERVLRTFCGT
ncbi:protein adenylyltransferase SelO [Paenirhodobacter populi]|uniref:Protein nucleotidyltransferase YdiU n=1 Tax=Paenirhodobacter populi TaxID=2306993 RepID=A0A443J2Z0_9RHOB|nr:YdiU family protein [Sinirhodobacter populi]RWR14696.1 YdiU family protein [Sinirhodobacter populi]